MNNLTDNFNQTYYLDKDNHITANLFMNSQAFAFALSYAGMRLEDIAEWYPEPITVDSVLDYLGQEHEFDIMENIIAYRENPMLEGDDIAAKLGLLDFCAYADWLSHRVCFMMFVGTDSWMILEDESRETRHRRLSHTTYKVKDFMEYITELEGGDKRYITRQEFEDFLDKDKRKRDTVSLYDKPYSIDSLFFALFQHGQEYGYDFDKIVEEVLVRDDQNILNPGVANEFLKYHDFLVENCQKGSKILSKDNIIYRFFEKISVEKENEQEDSGEYGN